MPLIKTHYWQPIALPLLSFFSQSLFFLFLFFLLPNLTKSISTIESPLTLSPLCYVFQLGADFNLKVEPQIWNRTLAKARLATSVVGLHNEATVLTCHLRCRLPPQSHGTVIVDLHCGEFWIFIFLFLVLGFFDWLRLLDDCFHCFEWDINGFLLWLAVSVIEWNLPTISCGC